MKLLKIYKVVWLHTQNLGRIPGFAVAVVEKSDEHIDDLLTTTLPPWLTLLTREWWLGSQPCHSLMGVAWHKVSRCLHFVDGLLDGDPS